MSSTNQAQLQALQNQCQGFLRKAVQVGVQTPEGQELIQRAQKLKQLIDRFQSSSSLPNLQNSSQIQPQSQSQSQSQSQAQNFQQAQSQVPIQQQQNLPINSPIQQNINPQQSPIRTQGPLTPGSVPLGSPQINNSNISNNSSYFNNNNIQQQQMQQANQVQIDAQQIQNARIQQQQQYFKSLTPTEQQNFRRNQLTQIKSIMAELENKKNKLEQNLIENKNLTEQEKETINAHRKTVLSRLDKYRPLASSIMEQMQRFVLQQSRNQQQPQQPPLRHQQSASPPPTQQQLQIQQQQKHQNLSLQQGHGSQQMGFQPQPHSVDSPAIDLQRTMQQQQSALLINQQQQQSVPSQGSAPVQSHNLSQGASVQSYQQQIPQQQQVRTSQIQQPSNVSINQTPALNSQQLYNSQNNLSNQKMRGNSQTPNLSHASISSPATPQHSTLKNIAQNQTQSNSNSSIETGQPLSRINSDRNKESLSAQPNPPPPPSSAHATKLAIPSAPIPATINVNSPPPTIVRASRPTLTGGYATPNPVLNTPVNIRAPAYDVPGDRILSKRRLTELVRNVVGEETESNIDGDVEELLLDMADEFVTNVTSFACRLAQHRKSDKLDVKDVQLHLERNWNIRIPGYSSDEIRSVRRWVPSATYTNKINAVNQARLMGSKNN